MCNSTFQDWHHNTFFYTCTGTPPFNTGIILNPLKSSRTKLLPFLKLVGSQAFLGLNYQFINFPVPGLIRDEPPVRGAAAAGPGLVVRKLFLYLVLSVTNRLSAAVVVLVLGWWFSSKYLNSSSSLQTFDTSARLLPHTLFFSCTYRTKDNNSSKQIHRDFKF